MSSKPDSTVSLEEAGMWALSRTVVLQEIVNIAAEMDGPAEEEKKEDDND